MTREEEGGRGGREKDKGKKRGEGDNAKIA